MKTKKDKKLDLNKLTLVNLENPKLNEIKAGWDHRFPSETCLPVDCS